MSIDWITVAAQIINFLVLVWLLKRFLYRPILDGIDARESEITSRMQQAIEAKQKAKEAESDYHARMSALQSEQSDLSDTVRQKAEEQRDALLAEAHSRMDKERKVWEAHLTEEGRKYTAKLHRAGAGALLSLTRKALVDLADDTLEARIAHHLATRFKPMVKDVRHAAGKLAEAVVTSHDPLPAAAQDEIKAEFQSAFPDVTLRFNTDPDQAPGLMVRMGGAQLAWTVDTYLDGLDALMDEHLAAGTELKVQPHDH